MTSSSLELRFLELCREVGLPEPMPEYVFALPRKWRFDFAWPALKVAAEVEGGTFSRGRHCRGKGFENDCRKYNRAAALGWVVFRFTGAMINNVEIAALECCLRVRSETT